jgi:hypothetical protein
MEACELVIDIQARLRRLLPQRLEVPPAELRTLREEGHYVRRDIT